MIKNIYILLLLFSLVKSQFLHSQNKSTVNTNAKSAAAAVKFKIMVIPFESKMYMSEIDHKINEVTKFNQQQIKWSFRKGINDQMSAQLKQNFEVVNMLADSGKTAKELSQLYNFITYRFDKIPDPVHYKPPVPDKNEKGIIKGQVNNTSSNTDDHFMNAQVLNPNLIPGLYAKYKTDVFLFITQIDLISGQKALGAISTTSPNRVFRIHYTVYTVDAKEIHSGMVKVNFPTNANTPNQILALYSSKACIEIRNRIEKALFVSKSGNK